MGACGSGRDGRGRPRSSFPAERAGSARLSPESLQERPIPSSRRDTGVEGRGLGGACRDVEGRGLMGPPPVTTENAVVPPVRLVLGEMGLERSAWRFRRVPLALDDGWGGRDLEERAQVRRRFQKGAEKEKPSLERPQWQGAKEVGSRGERREGQASRPEVDGVRAAKSREEPERSVLEAAAPEGGLAAAAFPAPDPRD